ncbi:MAG: outer membrane protein assembly factor BamD, partial [Candidatus Omnitrophota bacterium]|nr:outer membrane protein assembly factor BamD [Candidatus Omnitrophota bacterium]
SKLTAEADKMHQALREKKAQSDFSIAEFYWKQKQYGSAEIYYRNIVENYPETATAKTAEERLRFIEKRTKK